MHTRIVTLGLALGGLMFTAGAWAVPAQSALAQQEADQEKAAQQAKTSSTNAGTAKPAAATSTVTAGTATKPAATTPKASTPASKPAPKSAAVKPAPKKVPAKPVVYVNDGLKEGANGGAATATASGGDSKSTKPQNREVVKAFEQSCPDVTLTEERAKAGYDVSLEREPGSKGVKTVFGLTNVVHKTNRIEVTSKSGKEVFSEVGHSTNQLVKDACAALATPPTKVAKN